MMQKQKVPPVFETNVASDTTIVADQEAFFADAATPTHPPIGGFRLSLNPPIGLWWARGSRVGGGLGWRRVVGGVNRPGLVCLGVLG